MSNALIWIFAGICAWGCLIGAALSFANINTGVFLSPVFAALIGIAILAVGASFLYVAHLLCREDKKELDY